MSPLSPISPRNSGFVKLGAKNDQYTMDPGGGIPLTQVQSHASSPGARRRPSHTPIYPTISVNDRPDQQQDGSISPDNEKHGLFSGTSTGLGAGGRRQKSGDLTRSSTGEVRLNAMGRLYSKIVSFSPVMRYVVYVVPVALILMVPLIVLSATGHKEDIFVGSVSDEEGKVTNSGPPLFRLLLWIEIAWLTLWVGKVVAHVVPGVFIFFCGVVSSGTRKYATILRNLEIALSLFFWALASWITFRSLFHDAGKRGISWVVTLTRILGALFASSAVYLVEKAIVQLIGISYHQRSFSNRIHDSKREVYLLGVLYDASRALFPMYCPEFAEEDYIINDSIDVVLQKKVGSAAAPVRLIGEVGRIGDKVTSVFGNIASEITGKQVFNPNAAHSIIVEALEKVKTSEALARRIWMSFAVEGQDALLPDDLHEVLGPSRHDEAEEAFAAIDTDSNGDISLDEMVSKVVEIGKERKAISEGMKDISQALRVFDKVLLFVVLLIVIFIFLAFFQSSFITTLTTAGTTLLSLSFIFAVTAQEFLGSCIFLFVKHPYDVGDRVDATVSGERLRLNVDKISLLYTVFTRIDKMQVVQTPNIVLNTLWIENVTRSKAMHETIDVNINFDTSFEDIELLRQELESFVRHSDNSRDFFPDVYVSVGGVNDLDKLLLNITLKHKSNWHLEAVRAKRRSKFMCALVLALRKVPIYGPGAGDEALGAVGNPSYSVTISDAEAAANRDTAAKNKDAKRLVPAASKENDDEDGEAGEGTANDSSAGGNFTLKRLASEKAAAANINAARPVVDEFDASDDGRSMLSRRTSQYRRQGDGAPLTKHQSGRRVAGQAAPPLNLSLSPSRPSMSSIRSPARSRYDEESGLPTTGATRLDPHSGSIRRNPSLSVPPRNLPTSPNSHSATSIGSGPGAGPVVSPHSNPSLSATTSPSGAPQLGHPMPPPQGPPPAGPLPTTPEPSKPASNAGPTGGPPKL